MISCLAATSMPRVGSSRISSRGSVASQRASSAFCWLPPESMRDRRLDVGGLDAERRDEALGDRRLPRARQDCARCRARACSASDDVLAHRQLGDDALGLAVLGAERQAARDRVERRWRTAPRLPSIAQRRRWSRAVEPEQQPRQSRCGPSRAARRGRRPRRRAASRSIRLQLTALAQAARLRARGAAPSAARAGASARPGRRAGELAPDHRRRSGPAAAARRPGTRRRSSPLRSTVMRSEIAYTWSRKWVTNRIAMPCAAQPPQHREQRLDLVLVEARGRLVEDQHLAPDDAQRRAAIATICWTATG